MGKEQDWSEEITSILGLLKGFTKRKDVHGGSALHAHILRTGLIEKSPHIASSLISFYAKCGDLSKAQQVLKDLPVRDVVSWSVLIAGYARHGRGHDALRCFESMQTQGIPPDEITFTCILKACASIGAVDKGRQIHDEIANKGLLQKNIVLGTALVDMYAKCGVLEKAQRVLEALPARNVVSWSALISGYVQHGQCNEALDCFRQMQKEGVSPNEFTFACILKACGSVRAIGLGEQIHDKIVSRGLLKRNIVLGTALIDMYAKCGELAKAQLALESLQVRDTVSWNALISGCAQQEQGAEILDFFSQMQREGLSPDEVTFICILKACGIVKDIDKGNQIHNEIISGCFLENSILLASALVDMYAKCGVLEKAQQVLEELPVRDTIVWNTLISGYVQHELGCEALNCYVHMQRESLSPDEITFVCILKACGSIGAIDKGKQIHNEIASGGVLRNNIMLGTALVDMYAKCGVFAKAAQVLKELPIQDTISWNALITGYSQEGEFHEVLKCFQQMQQDGVSPNEVTFLCVLNACARTGNLDEAKMYYESMSTEYGITPKLEHHACMVVVFGCLGQFDKAMSVIKAMPSSDDPSLWLALLNACRKWGNLEVGKLAFDQTIQLDKNLAAAYVLMANMYAITGIKKTKNY